MYHSCTRELTKFASDRICASRHYVSILAEALGVAKPDRFSQYWRMGDPAAGRRGVAAELGVLGLITEQEALALAHKYFVPSYAARAPECPCNGTCSRTGSDWLLPHGV